MTDEEFAQRVIDAFFYEVSIGNGLNTYATTEAGDQLLGILKDKLAKDGE